MRLLFASIVGLFAVCTALTGLVHAAARRDPPARVAALLPDPDCAAPCWQGLRPGYASARDLQAWIDAPPPGWTLTRQEDLVPTDGSLQHWMIQQPATLRLTILQSPQPTNDQLMLEPRDLALGDLIAAHGAPEYFDLAVLPSPRLIIRLYYPADRLIAQITLATGAHFLWPSTRIDSLIYSAVPWTRPLVALDWRGPIRLEVDP